MSLKQPQQQLQNKFYTSRSRIETFQECPRRGYINFLWDGRGIVKKGASVYLSTGTYVHLGLEHIFRAVKDGLEILEGLVDTAVFKATSSYRYEISNRGFDLEEGEDRANERYVVDEQCALVEGFIRAFCVQVLPDLLARYRVVDVEREEIYKEGNLIIQGRIDVVLEEIETSDIFIVSFKTAAGWDRRQEKANEHDNQGLSETFLLEQRLSLANDGIRSLAEVLDTRLVQLDQKVVGATKKYLEYISKFAKNDKVMGVLMIYFLKGKRSETSKGSGKWEQHNPLIRAYRKLVGVDYEYSPSLYYEKAENKSGWGRLGKGWDSFSVWEEEGGVKEWVRKLASDEVQGGRRILEDQFKIPSAYSRKQDHLDSWYRQTRAIENGILENTNEMKTDLRGRGELKELLDYYFPQRRKACHFPNDCSYVDVCYTDEIFVDPIGSGKYVYRTPHHEAELKEHERLYRIAEVPNISTRMLQSGGVSREVNNNIDDEEVIEG